MVTPSTRRFCGRVSRVISVCATSLICQICLAGTEVTWRMGAQPSELIMVQVTVSNIGKSFDFYTKLLGMKRVYVPGEPKRSLDDESADKRKEIYLNYSGSFADAF